MKDKKLALAVLILIIFHAVGFYGLVFSQNPAWFRALTPFNLLLTSLLLFAFHKTWTFSFLIFAFIVMLVGFCSEIIGVHTGLLYGNYYYGQSLGVKLWEIPLVIGLNWLLLVYVTGLLVQPLTQPWPVKALLAAALMVLLDSFIEPVAALLDYWTWDAYRIPASNYWGWLGVAFILQSYFQKAHFQKHNPLAPAVFGIQLLFFVWLNLFL